MSDIRDFVMVQPLFCHHDHHGSYPEFDAGRMGYNHESLLGYASADLVTAAGSGCVPTDGSALLADYWCKIRTTGYGRAVDLMSRTLFDLEYTPEKWPAIAEAIQAYLADKTAAEVYEDLVIKRAKNIWTLQDGRFRCDNGDAFRDNCYPASYRYAFRMDSLLAMVDAGPIDQLQTFTALPIYTLDSLVDALNLAIDLFQETGELAAIKIGMAYQRDLVVGNPTHYEAEAAFNRIRNRKAQWDGLQQNQGAVDAASARALGDYMFHALIHRAADEDIPVQIHTGYLAGNWGALAGSRAMNLVPMFEKYRTVRFDLFHASWPWASELGVIAKNYPNVWADMCWAWAMNPAESERALSEWLDGVPFNKIFAYGADTRLPWCNVGYSLQARVGISRVLEQKIAAGYFSPSTAREVAEHIMLGNGVAFYGLDS